MGRQTTSFAGRVFRWCLFLLPPEARHQDGAEMLLLFEDLWRENAGPVAKAKLVLRSFGRLPAVALAAWTRDPAVRHPLRALVAQVKGVGGQFRFAIRSLWKARIFSFAAVALLGIGIGAVTTIFSIVDHVLLRPLPYPEVERLVFVGDGLTRREWEAHSGPLIQAMQEIEAIDQWAIAHSNMANLTGDGDPRRVTASVVSQDFFTVFGGRAALGRLIQPDDFAGANRVVISHAIWTGQFGSDPDVVGRTIGIDGAPVAVVGVMEEGFQPPQALVASEVDVWMPIDWRLEQYNRIDTEDLEVAGRLRTGVTMGAAQAEFDALAEAMAEAYPDRFTENGRIDPLPLIDFQQVTVQRVREGLYLLLGAVALLLLVACLNVAHLFLARGVARLKEMRVRRALGASSSALVQQLLAESLVIGFAGCGLGVLLARGGLEVLLRLNPGGLPIGTHVGIDGPILVFAALVSGGTALVFGLLPALRAAKGSLVSAQLAARGATEGVRGGRLRRGLVVAEVALSLILVTQAGLLLKSFARVQAHEPGLDEAGVLTVRLFHPGAESGESFVATMNEVRRSIEGVPGVQAAAYGLNLPFQVTGGGRVGWSNRFEMIAAGVLREPIFLRQKPVSPSYFEALGIPMASGEAWSEAEGIGQPLQSDELDARQLLPVVLSERAADYFFGSAEAAVGEVMQHGDGRGRQWLVRGVARDVRHWGLDQPVPDAVYLPTFVIPRGFQSISMAVKVAGAGSPDMQRAIQQAVWRAAPDVPVPEIVRMSTLIGRSTAGRRFDSVLFGLFGTTGLVLAGAGLAGTLLFAVRLRWRELGIRMALGASSATVQRHVVVDGLRMAVLGAGFGLVGAWLTGRFLESRLYEVGANDFTTFLIATLVLLATAALASWIPARGAGKADPLMALSAE